MTTIYDIIADPTRRRILDLLREQPRAVGDLVNVLDISQPGVSKQLRVLREAGLVRVEKDAQRRVYTLQPEPLAEVDEWLASYRLLWEGRFDRLDAYLNATDENTETQSNPDEETS
jgi:DNA-binding transcriptional ArsR family regulator